MEVIVKEATYIVTLLAELIAILIILSGVIKTTILFLRSLPNLKFEPDFISTLRIQLGGSLSLSLEFLIGADILKTAISPTWNEIGMLGAVIIIRTVLNFFLNQDLYPKSEKPQ